MSEKESSGVVSGIAHAAAAFAHTPFPYLLGMAFMLAATHWDGHLRDVKGCFQLQEIRGRIFKVDTCSGKTEEIEPVQGAASEKKTTTDIAAPTK